VKTAAEVSLNGRHQRGAAWRHIVEHAPRVGDVRIDMGSNTDV
jgi:hypothetical protein